MGTTSPGIFVSGIVSLTGTAVKGSSYQNSGRRRGREKVKVS